jgi:hypothetical protein
MIMIAGKIRIWKEAIMAYFVLSTSLPVEDEGNTAMNFTQGSHLDEIRTGYIPHTGPGRAVKR